MGHRWISILLLPRRQVSGSTIFTHLGGSGSSIFGITCPGEDMSTNRKDHWLTEEGKRWFSKQRAERLKYATANAQRPFLTPPETLVLVKGGKDNYVAPIRRMAGDSSSIWRIQR